MVIGSKLRQCGCCMPTLTSIAKQHTVYWMLIHGVCTIYIDYIDTACRHSVLWRTGTLEGWHQLPQGWVLVRYYWQLFTPLQYGTNKGFHFFLHGTYQENPYWAGKVSCLEKRCYPNLLLMVLPNPTPNLPPPPPPLAVNLSLNTSQVVK